MRESLGGTAGPVVQEREVEVDVGAAVGVAQPFVVLKSEAEHGDGVVVPTLGGVGVAEQPAVLGARARLVHPLRRRDRDLLHERPLLPVAPTVVVGGRVRGKRTA